ncbi:MAG: SH3 domain-containing protein [Planctomycetota bacterium]
MFGTKLPIAAVAAAVVLCHVSPALAETHRVTASALNVRTGPSLRYRILGQLRSGAQVNVVAASGDWRQIQYRGGLAWVHGAYLARLAQTPPPAPAASGPSAWDRTPPAADYRRLVWRGVRVNRRTVELVLRAERIMADLGHRGFRFAFSQGSYSTSVAASGGTHAGGGALDIRTVGQSRRTVDDMVRALRRAGFAAWSRGRGYDSFAPHIHAIAIGDREASSSARSQVGSYARGRNGLVNQALDPDRNLGRNAPQWARRFL